MNNGHKESQQTSNSDKLSNLELWGVNVDFKSYEQNWIIHGILQHLNFYPPTENPCVMIKENFKTKCSEYIVKEHGEQIIVQENKLLSTNYTVKTQN